MRGPPRSNATASSYDSRMAAGMAGPNLGVRYGRAPALSTFCSFFQQMLELFPRSEFEKLVKEFKAERHARGFGSWEQFVSELCDGRF